MDPVTSGKNVLDMNEMESKSLVSQKIDHKQNDDPDDPDSSESVSNENQYCFQGNRNSETTTTKTLLEKNTTELVANTKMNAQLKRNYACICLFALLIGTDFAVIIPTLWDRLSSDFEATGTFMGIVMSSYSLSGVVCGLIMGKISDEINKTKSFLLISIFFGIIGHILYFIGISKWLVLLGRVISGLCLGASTVLLAYVAKTTNEKQRTSVISLVMASRQIGLMFAPAFNLFLRKFNFYLFDTILVDRKSAPGMFMAILWSISFVVVVVVYREYFPPQPETTTGGSGPITPAFSLLNKNIYKKEFLRIEIFILLGVTFFTYFNQTSIETIVIPFTEIMFGWTEFENSILFCLGGVVIILSYIGIRLMSKKLADRWIMLMGVVIICTGLIIACSCLPFAKQLSSENVRLYLRKIREDAATKKIIRKEHAFLLETSGDEVMGELGNVGSLGLNLTQTNATTILSNSTNQTLVYHDNQLFPAFVVFVALDVLGLPAISICSASLFTKLIDNKVQGIGQGIQRGVLGIGTIFGPLLAGPLIYKPVILLAITLSFIVTILGFLLAFFKLFRIEKTPSSSSTTTKNHAEKTKS